MHKQERLTPAQQELESVLSQIRPRQDVLNHELFLFNAGRASVGTKRPWQIVSGMLTLLLAYSVLIRFDVDVPQRDLPPAHLTAVQKTLPPDLPRASASLEASAYLGLRQRVVRRGLDALPSQASMPGTSMTRPQNRTLWLERML